MDSTMEDPGLYDIAYQERPANYQFATDGSSISVFVPNELWEIVCNRLQKHAGSAEKRLRHQDHIDYLPKGSPVFSAFSMMGDKVGYGGLIATRQRDDGWVEMECPLPDMTQPLDIEPSKCYPTKKMDIYCFNLDLMVGGLLGINSSVTEYQLASLVGGVSPLGLDVRVSRYLARWIGNKTQEQQLQLGEDVSTVMCMADHGIHKGFKSLKDVKPRMGVYADFVGESRVSLNCHISNSGSIQNMGGQYYMDRSGYGLIVHNIFGPAQTLVIMVGLAKLCEMARVDLRKNPLVID